MVIKNKFADQPTINEATNNVVEGINLDEIKEFAKVFKLRRLSLGLTQTQVGQALSVTEGPAYSQSAICRWDIIFTNIMYLQSKICDTCLSVIFRWMCACVEREQISCV